MTNTSQDTKYPYSLVEGRRFSAEEHHLAVYFARHMANKMDRPVHVIRVLDRTTPNEVIYTAEPEVESDEALLRQALEALKAENEMLRKVLKEADNELDWLDEEVDTCDHSVGVCVCLYWDMRRKMKAALSKGDSNAT